VSRTSPTRPRGRTGARGSPTSIREVRVLKRPSTIAVIALAAAAAIVGGALAVVVPHADAAPEISDAGLVSLALDGFRYEYHLPTGHEALLDADDANVLPQHADLAVTCRRILSMRLGVRDLADLRSRYSGTIRRLHALGYM
jgi:hypothetical protein